MGKSQSKHGECYLVNAHFNPLCQLEDSGSLQSVETPITSKDSGLQLTPEISFTLSEDDKSHSEKNHAKKCAFEVFLPKETVNAALSDSVMDIKLENASIDIPLKKQHRVSLECVKNEKHLDQQEFSFILRNYAAQETDKEDSEKVILRSICDALKSTLKFPPSGTHTLKVHLTVSPGNENDKGKEKTPVTEDAACKPLPSNKEDVSSKKQCQHSPEKPPLESSGVKHPSAYSKCCQQETLAGLKCSPFHDVYPSPHSKRHKLFSERKDARKWMDVTHLGQRENFLLYSKNTPEPSVSKEKHHHLRTEQRLNSKECSNYLDLADLKSSCHNQESWDPRYVNPAYCSPRHVGKNHRLCHYQKQGNQRKHVASNQRSLESELHSGILKYKLLQKAKHNLLDLSFDLCDLEEKPVENPYHHRRSRSYDTNQYSLVNSPNLRHRSSKCSKCVPHCNDDIPPSPSRHHRHCHRKREKDKLRAMEQVAAWLNQEELNQIEQQKLGSDAIHLSKDTLVERHEYHHIHEHHHYYHYLES